MYNPLETIKADIFQGQHNLVTLHLGICFLKNLDNVRWDSLKKLSYLTIMGGSPGWRFGLTEACLKIIWQTIVPSDHGPKPPSRRGVWFN